MQRSMDKLISNSVEDAKEDLQNNPIRAIFADGRKDNTLVLTRDEKSRRYHKRTVQEEHITVTEEPKGKYLTHFTPTSEPPFKPAYIQAKALYEFLVDHGLSESILLVGGDTTNSMSGAKGGLWAHLEEMIGRPLFRVMCFLHINELPLRHLMTSLDGPTSSDKGWTGPIGKLLTKVNKMKRLSKFEPMVELKPTEELDEQTINSLSTDSQLAYRLVKAMVLGKLDETILNRLVGNLSHARWLTTAEAILLLQVSEHDLCHEDERKLKLISKWVLQVYLHQFFSIKCNPGIANGPHHLLNLIKLYQGQDCEVKEIVAPYLKSEAWWAHPENLLLSLLCSEKESDRIFAVNQIKLSRSKVQSKKGKKKIREFRVPSTFDLEADSLISMIHWEEEFISEPSFTIKLSNQQLTEIINKKMNPPDFPCHSQSCERAVKAVTEASGKVCGWDKRDGFIRATMANRELIPVFSSKKDILPIFSCDGL